MISSLTLTFHLFNCGWDPIWHHETGEVMNTPDSKTPASSVVCAPIEVPVSSTLPIEFEIAVKLVTRIICSVFLLHDLIDKAELCPFGFVEENQADR
jgi:hypothetical protein